MVIALCADAPIDKSQPISGAMAWRGTEIERNSDWIYHLSAEEIAELEKVGMQFLDNDPDLRTVTADSYPLPICRNGIVQWTSDMECGRGFVLVRGLRARHYSDALSAAIFFVIGLNLGNPMRQNEMGDSLVHVMATSDKLITDPGALATRIRDRLNYHSDSSDIVSLMCLRTAKEGGASSLISGATLYNEALRRRPDLAPMMFEPWHYDWRRQDPQATSPTYVTPMCSLTDGVFSVYIGTRLIRTAQDYPEVPRLSPQQIELLDLLDDICRDPAIPLHMDFQPGDMQWVLNYAGLHSRTAFKDHPEPERRRHLLRLWLTSREKRVTTPGFGRNVVKARNEVRGSEVPPEIAKFHITQAAIPRPDYNPT